MNYSSFPTPVPGWQTDPPHGMGFAVQYNTAVPMPTFQQSLKASNSFDVNSELPSVQASTFLPMASSQGALPNVRPPSGLVRTSRLGAPTSAWMPLQASSYSSGLPLQVPTGGNKFLVACHLPGIYYFLVLIQVFSTTHLL